MTNLRETMGNGSRPDHQKILHFQGSCSMPTTVDTLETLELILLGAACGSRKGARRVFADFAPWHVSRERRGIFEALAAQSAEGGLPSDDPLVREWLAGLGVAPAEQAAPRRGPLAVQARPDRDWGSSLRAMLAALRMAARERELTEFARRLAFECRSTPISQSLAAMEEVRRRLGSE
jgi:hypothetical protein